ncbi:MAG: bifunctional phosphopantothenoylcysteine decarboxylase/phosphopantothenate--cysteine ligase CoaBC [Betaproteobacteria bacterium]|jgi:phosphopantothenoylcysteine decarboxylase/phosphopantothenate--cysteine ligase|nr:bifunctional phosphopantothenoylcysteine decarboxylase/phosphopantothenate--cysteine ligase CoaBC [Nitrosomonadales bacterium]MCH9771818.1 bifunctional phosphopantothenoylcysteine decarboxylase/phosphopantothenate--cysteine ligase CoaBC [Betaproteobacteria bacterium]
MLKKKILLGVTGSVAAYKAAELIRLLRKNDFFVQVVLTKSAKQFVTPLTLQALSGNPVLENMWEPSEGNGMEHINLSRTADLILIAPTSGNFIAKLANGLADDLLTNLCLARSCPLLVAPAMNVEMFENNATQRNLKAIKEDGVLISGPDLGEQACGEVGLGRLINFESLMLDIKKALTPQIFINKKILISSGATVEKIDEARAITNLSSGLMGLNLAKTAYTMGADVTVVSGNSNYELPQCIKKISAKNHEAMYQSIVSNIENNDIYISAAAISDYKPSYTKGKIKKGSNLISIDLEKTKDILSYVGENFSHKFLVGFAAESENVVENGKNKLLSKNLDIVIGNEIKESMGKTKASMVIIDHDKNTILPKAEKDIQSRIILEYIFKLLSKEKAHDTIN